MNHKCKSFCKKTMKIKINSKWANIMSFLRCFQSNFIHDKKLQIANKVSFIMMSTTFFLVKTWNQIVRYFKLNISAAVSYMKILADESKWFYAKVSILQLYQPVSILVLTRHESGWHDGEWCMPPMNDDIIQVLQCNHPADIGYRKKLMWMRIKGCFLRGKYGQFLVYIQYDNIKNYGEQIIVKR